MKIEFGKVKKDPDGFGWLTSDGTFWGYRGNAISRQRWLNMQLWLDAVKLDEIPYRINSEAVNQLQRAMVVLR